MGFKFTIAKPDGKDVSTSISTLNSTANAPQLAHPKEDWAEKTHSSWNEHAGFLEKSGLIKLAPPPRLDPRTVPRPDAATLTSSRGLSPSARIFAMGFVMAIGVGFGLYSNGALNPLLRPLGFGVGEEIANALGNTLHPIARRATSPAKAESTLPDRVPANAPNATSTPLPK